MLTVRELQGEVVGVAEHGDTGAVADVVVMVAPQHEEIDVGGASVGPLVEMIGVTPFPGPGSVDAVSD